MLPLLFGFLILTAQVPNRGWLSDDPDGPPQRVTIQDLLRRAGQYHGKAVLVTGRLREGDSYDRSRHIYELRDEKLLTIKVISPGRRQPNVIDPIGALVDHVVEVTGVFSDLSLVVGPDNPDGDREDRRYVIYAVGARAVEKEPEGTPGVEGKAIHEVGSDLEEIPGPPRVVRSYPRSGERGISLETEFQVWFSNEMDPKSFEGRVRVVYSGRAAQNASPPSLRLSYDAGSRALRVSLDQSLRPLSEIRLLLGAGIVDKEGQALLPLPSEPGSRPLRSRRAAVDGEVLGAVVELTFFTRGV